MIGLPLPGRDLSPEEARGFRMACAAFSTWGYQLAASPRLAGPEASEEVRSRFAAHGRFLMAAASALDRQITRSIPVEALVEITGAPMRGQVTRLTP
ncbi:MAG: hypothetical protein ACK47C_07805 [Paracoccaceae bacterium]